MAGRITYCEADDVNLLFSSIRLPIKVDMTLAIEAAADEMDGYIGHRYLVPIQVDLADPSKRYGSTLLKTTNAQLAAGRIITAAATGGEKNQVHEYGKYLINNALTTCRALRDGRLDLVFAETSEEEGLRSVGPFVIGDAFSQVSAFYQNYEPRGFMPGWTPRKDVPWPLT